jgi:hypothetical protein
MEQMIFIEVKKIIPVGDDVRIEKEFIRADKIETFRSYKKNEEHSFSKVKGDIIKVIMKSLSNYSNRESKGIYEVYVNESPESFQSRLNGNGVTVISDGGKGLHNTP